MTGRRIFFYVQYLQGVGHLYRAAHIARAMASAGLEVDLVSGGMPVPTLELGGVRLHQLEPVRSRNGEFSDLIDAGGAPVDDALRLRRRQALLELFNACRPDALVIEAFPFGRRQMRFELLPLLDAAKASTPSPLVVCSVRDILQISDKPSRAENTLETIRASFDHVLVHGDPTFARLADTFAGAEQIADRTRYTGLVADSSRDVPTTQATGDGEILVSAGGGGTRSERLLTSALAARPLSAAGDRPWRLLAGPNLPRAELEKLSESLADGVTLEANRNDFPDLLARCVVSVSQAGYNTVVDLLRCGCRAVLVPYAEYGQTEQLFRARRMRELGLAQLVAPDALDGPSLARAIDAALAAPAPGPARIELDGAEKSAALVASWLGA